MLAVTSGRSVQRLPHTRPDSLNLGSQFLQHLHFLNRDIVRHDDAAIVTPTREPRGSGKQVSDTYFARPTVASEMPVLPTVPSKRIEPVFG